MINFDEFQSDIESNEQKHKEVPSSVRPRFMNQVMIRHKNRKRTETKKRTNKVKIEQQVKTKVGSHHKVSFMTAQPSEQKVQRRVTYVHGNKIDGTWKQGNLHGNVIIQYQTGEYFQGKYLNGIRISGLVKFKDGTQYKGGFLRDIFHGQGTLKDPSGRIITCQWEEGQPLKKAKIQYPSGEVYFGQIQNLKKHGHGHLFFKNGNKYIGYFTKGTITGFGIYYENDKKVAEGIWQNGVLEISQSVKQILQETLTSQKNRASKKNSEGTPPKKGRSSIKIKMIDSIC